MKQKYTQLELEKFNKIMEIKKDMGKVEKEFIEYTTNFIKYIKKIPGIKMIGIGNSVSMNCADSESDIDLYIVSENSKMWFVRIILTFIFSILGVRKTHKYHKKRFCLSFFSTIDGMDFSSFCIKNDIYLYFWIVYFKPILSYDNTYELFLEKNNSWADFGEFEEKINENKKFIKYSGKKNKVFNNIIIFLDKICKNIFLQKTLKHFNSLNKPYGIIINNNLLKFHNNDIRKEFSENFFGK